jgi:hypothetical protein
MRNMIHQWRTASLKLRLQHDSSNFVMFYFLNMLKQTTVGDSPTVYSLKKHVKTDLLSLPYMVSVSFLLVELCFLELSLRIWVDK